MIDSGMKGSPALKGTVTRCVVPGTSSSCCDHRGVDTVTLFGLAPEWIANSRLSVAMSDFTIVARVVLRPPTQNPSRSAYT